MIRRTRRVTNQTEAITSVALETQSPQTPVIMTVGQVAALLQVPPSSIYERTRFRGNQGSIPPLPHRRVGRYLRFFREEIIKWLFALPQASHPRKRKYVYKNPKTRAA
jgi:hypothetical protein